MGPDERAATRKVQLGRYGGAVLSVALAVGVRLLLDPFLGDQFPYATLFFAVLIVARYGGARPALLAVGLGGLAADYFLLTPRGTLAFSDPTQAFGLGVYLTVGAGIASLAEDISVFDGDKLWGFADVIRDLKERQRASLLLGSILDNASDAMLSVDETGIIQSFNRGGERLFGYTASELIGRNVSMLMPEPHRTHHEGYMAEYGRTQIAKVIGRGRDVQAQRKDGSLFPAHLAVTGFQLDGKRYFSGIVRDLSERNALEDQLRQAQKMEAIGRLAGGVAHDFNNLLSVILSYSELLLSELPPDGVGRDELTEVAKAGRRAAELTRQLLLFSRQQLLEPKVINVNDLLAGMERMLRRMIGEDVVLTCSLAPTLGRIRGDIGLIEQVVMNLAVNSRDAMPTGGALVIETQNVILDDAYVAEHLGARPGPHVALSVRDTGTGMDPATMARIFEPFFTTKERGKGTGLGLSTVFGIVHQLEGSIWVESEPGAGATFTLFLPRVEEALVELRTQDVQPSLNGSERVLLVEDESEVRAVVASILHRLGYRVLEASNGSQALLRAVEDRGMIHLLLSDVIMPGISGPELASRLKQLRPEMQVLLMSGYTHDAMDRQGGLPAGAHFLQKPITPRALAEKVREALSGG